jgi:fimbrial isopeptide formation D2 family protein/uncharacterized repeat protein (TIGR01451 family)
VRCAITPTPITNVNETIAAVANKIYSSVAGPNPPSLGGTMTITGVGETGLIGAAQIFQLTPASAPDWPADSFTLTNVHIDYWNGTVCPDANGSVPASSPTNTYDDVLSFTTPGTVNSCYRIIYTFSADGTTSGTTDITPNNNISSGSEIKHTGATPASIVPIQSASNTTTLTKSVDPTALSTGGTATYTVTLSNSGVSDVTLDKLTDDIPASTTYTNGSSTFNSTSIGDPVIVGQTLTWTGDFAVSASGTSTLTYAVTVPNIVGGYDNSAVGFIGSDQIDTTVSLSDDAPATASVTNGAAPTITKTFSPDVILPGNTSTLTITLANSNGSDLTEAAFTDTYPTGLVNADPTNASSTCGGTLTAVAGEATLSLSGGTIPSTSNCTISVDVTSSTESTYTNTIGVGDLTDAQDLPNDTAASDDLYVQGISLTKSIADTSQSNTTGSELTIGEIATYNVVLTIPALTVPNVVLSDTLPDGLAFVDCLSITPSSGDVTTNLAGGFSDACNDSTNPTVLSDGTAIQFSLGNITNSGSAAETLTVSFSAVVTNIAANQHGSTLSNSATVNWDGGSNTSDTVDATIAEPAISVTKSVDPVSGDGGNQITFTIEVSNPLAGIDAYNVSLYDYVPSDITYDAGSFVNTSGLAPDSTSEDPMPLTATWSTFPAGSTSQFQFTGTIVSTIDAGDTIYNDAIAKYTSLPGEPGSLSTYNSLAYERTGNESDPGGTANDYTTTDSADIAIGTPYVDKQAPASSTFTIGEEATYPLLVTLPEGTTLSLLVEDGLPEGQEYVSYEIVTAAASSGGLLAEDFSGSALSPTVTAPGGSGGDVTFEFGNVDCTVDTGTPAPDNNSFVIFLTTRILDVPTNTGGTALENYATIQYVDPNTSGTVSTTDGPVSVTVVEPTLTMNKTFSPDKASIGETVQVTLSVENTGTSPAYDVIIEDLLPTATFASVAENTTRPILLMPVKPRERITG